jgi:hypothetical protein
MLAQKAEMGTISGLSTWLRFGTTVRRIASRIHSKAMAADRRKSLTILN